MNRLGSTIVWACSTVLSAGLALGVVAGCTGGSGGGGGSSGQTVDDFDVNKNEFAGFRTGVTTWDKTDLTWALVKPSGLTGLTDAQIEDGITIATNLWGDNSTLTFTRADDPDAADIRLAFEVREHGDGEDNAFDGSGGVLAHAFFPGSTYQGESMDGQLHADDEEAFTMNLPDADTMIDLAFVVTHEMGHNLGLVHSSVPQAVMAPSYQPWNERALHPDDIARIQELYGAPDGTAAPIRARPPEFDPEADPAAPTPTPSAPDDFDEDGLGRAFERYFSGTDPYLADTDGDGLNDGAEVTLGTNPLAGDTDDDGVSDFDEVQAPRSNPSDPCDPTPCQPGTVGDTDGDGLGNAAERVLGTNPEMADTDGDLLGDYQEARLGTDPLVADSDGDGCEDGSDDYPLNAHYGCDGSQAPSEADADADGLSNTEETQIFDTDPYNADTDADGLNDFWEATWWLSDPLDPCSPLPSPACSEIGTDGTFGTDGSFDTNGF